MFPSVRSSRRGLFACGVVSLLAAGCASPPPVAERYVAPKVGTTWEYRVTSTGSFGNGTVNAPMRVVETTLDGRKLLRFESPAGATLQTDKVDVVAVLDPAGRTVMRYDPPLSYEWPLEVGRAWTGEYVVTTASGARMPMKASWKVEAVEDVTVSAGTFQAWRVSMTDSFGLRQTTWSVPEKMGVFARRVSERPAGHPQGAGTQVLELLRAPAFP
jgi:hypothetical protein